MTRSVGAKLPSVFRRCGMAAYETKRPFRDSPRLAKMGGYRLTEGDKLPQQRFTQSRAIFAMAGIVVLSILGGLGWNEVSSSRIPLEEKYIVVPLVAIATSVLLLIFSIAIIKPATIEFGDDELIFSRPFMRTKKSFLWRDIKSIAVYDGWGSLYGGFHGILITFSRREIYKRDSFLLPGAWTVSREELSSRLNEFLDRAHDRTT